MHRSIDCQNPNNKLCLSEQYITVRITPPMLLLTIRHMTMFVVKHMGYYTELNLQPTLTFPLRCVMNMTPG